MAALDYEIVDRDGALRGLTAIRREDDWLTLAAAVDASDTAWTTTGDATGWPESGVACIGREAVLFTRVDNALTVTRRGAYRTEAAAHSTGDTLTHYPRHLDDRRSWVYRAADPDAHADAHGYFPGFIEAWSWMDRGQVLHLAIADQQMRMRRRLFRTIGEGVWNEDRTNEPTIVVMRVCREAGGSAAAIGLPPPARRSGSSARRWRRAR